LPLWLIGLVVIAIILSFFLPWARRFDQRVGDRRVAAGKHRSIVPVWLGIGICLALIVTGVMIYYLL